MNPKKLDVGWCWFRGTHSVDYHLADRLFDLLGMGSLVYGTETYRWYSHYLDAMLDLQKAEVLMNPNPIAINFDEAIQIQSGKVSKGTRRAAGWDVFCNIEYAIKEASRAERVLIRPGEIGIVPIGLVTRFPAGCVGLLMDKSGYARNNGLTILGGVIDGDYPEEWEAIVLNIGKEPFIFRQDDKVTQVLFFELSQRPVVPTGYGEVEYRDAVRVGGFGSTGTT